MREPVLACIKRALDGYGRMPELADVPGDASGRPVILAAVSGGADSLCLMLALKELGCGIHAVHVEHGIRGRESLDDCEFVRRVCAEMNIGLSVSSVDAVSYAKEFSMTLEEAARLLRHNALRKTASELGIRVIATAHHMADQAETVLWNMIRGSSLDGMGGIRPVRREGDIFLIRPLIECGRSDIEEYLRERNIPWRTDSTNNDVRFTRNAIRHKVLPVLSELNPLALRHISEEAADLREIQEFLERLSGDAFRNVRFRADGEHGYTADREELRLMNGVLRRRVLHRIIAQCAGGKKDISRAHIMALEHIVMGEGHLESHLPGGLEAAAEGNVLRLFFREAGTDGPAGADKKTYTLTDADEIRVEKSGRYRIDIGGRSRTADVLYMTWPGGEVPKKVYTKYLAYDTIAPVPVLRTRRPGDYLTVNASGGRRKLKDYLIDEKVPRSERGRLLLLAQGSHVLWIVGMRISEGAKVFEGARCIKIDITQRLLSGAGAYMPGGGEI